MSQMTVAELLDQLLVDIGAALHANHDARSQVEALLHVMELRVRKLQKLLVPEKTP